jgi:hypothetical protein
LNDTDRVVEHPCAGGTIDIAPLHGDLDIDCAVREDCKAGIRKIDLVPVCGDGAAEERD